MLNWLWRIWGGTACRNCNKQAVYMYKRKKYCLECLCEKLIKDGVIREKIYFNYQVENGACAGSDQTEQEFYTFVEQLVASKRVMKMYMSQNKDYICPIHLDNKDDQPCLTCNCKCETTRYIYKSTYCSLSELLAVLYKDGDLNIKGVKAYSHEDKNIGIVEDDNSAQRLSMLHRLTTESDVKLLKIHEQKALTE